MRYIKIRIQDVADGLISTKVTTELEAIFKQFGLNIDFGEDIGDKTLWQDIGEYRYIFLRAYDLPNKGRRYAETIDEINALENYCNQNGFLLVDSLPESEVLSE